MKGLDVKIIEIISIMKSVEYPRHDHLKEHSLEYIFKINAPLIFIRYDVTSYQIR